MAENALPRLLKLPAELRLQIYGYVINDIIIESEYPRVIITNRAILRLSRQVRAESFDLYLAYMDARAHELKKAASTAALLVGGESLNGLAGSIKAHVRYLRAVARIGGITSPPMSFLFRGPNRKNGFKNRS